MIDFHCHIDLYPSPQEVVEECRSCDVFVLSVTTTPSAWRISSQLPGAASRIKSALGLHPELASERRAELGLFEALLAETSFVGEIGLDGSPNLRNQWRDQIEVFSTILEMCARAGGRILTLHSRRAAGPLLQELRKHPNVGIAVLHWFSGSSAELKGAIEQGCWFSVGLPMLLSDRGRSIVAQLPRDRTLTESDGPFVRIGDKPMQPRDINQVEERLASLWNTSRTEIKSCLNANLNRLLLNQGIELR